MSRTGIWKRMRAVMDAALPPGSFERIIADLSDDERAAYDAWRAKCSALIQRYTDRDGPAGPYVAYLCGDLRLPPIWPPSLDAKIFPALAEPSDDSRADYEAIISGER